MPGYEIVGFDTDGDGKQELLAIDGKELTTYGVDGNVVRSTGVPGGGFVNAVQIAKEATESGSPEVIVGAYIASGADKGQWYHRFARDAQEHLGRTRTNMRVEPVAKISGHSAPCRSSMCIYLPAN